MSDYLSPLYTTQGTPRRASRDWLISQALVAKTEGVVVNEYLKTGNIGATDSTSWVLVSRGVRSWGPHKVTGVLYRNGVLHHGKVFLFERRGLRIIRETISNEAGEYLFDQVPEGTYLVMAFDTEYFWERPGLNATVTDWVVSQPRDE